MSYLEYYGLKKEPFSNAPVSQFYFSSPTHSQALARLTYAVSQSKGLALLMGEAGAGKTTLARRLLDTLAEDQYEAALLVIIHSGITAGWLLKRIAVQLGVEKPAEEKLALLGQLYQRLLAIHEQGKKAVVLIDEAQMLQTREIMEEFRGLLNLELPEQKLLTFILFGLPEMEQYLTLDPPLHQRVALKIRLTSLSAESTEAYIKHRLKLAGATRMPFSAEAVRAINRFAQGIPRVVNTLCDNCLFEGFLAKLTVVNEKLVHRSAADLGLTLGPEAPAAMAPVGAAGAAPAARPAGPTSTTPAPSSPQTAAPRPVAAPARPAAGGAPRPPPPPVHAAPALRTPGPVAAGTADGHPGPGTPPQRPSAQPRSPGAPTPRPAPSAARPLAVATAPSSGPRPALARPALAPSPAGSGTMTALRPTAVPSRPMSRPPPPPAPEPSAAAEMADLERFLTGTDKA